MHVLSALALALLLSLSLADAALARQPAPREGRTDSLQVDVDSLRFHVRIGYPVLRGVPAGVNAALRDSVEALAEAFRPREPVAADAPVSQATWVRGGTEVGLVRPELFSAVIGVYAYTGGAHGNTVFRSVNVDPRTGAHVAFEDVVTNARAVRDTLAAHTTRAVVDRLVAAFEETPEEARRSVEGYNRGGIRFERPLTFSFVPDSLVVHIPPYDVMPYAVGPFRVAVPLAALKPWLTPGGPAAAALSR